MAKDHKPPLRLIDLHTDWLLQYAPETTIYDPALYDGVTRRLGQIEGYLQGTSAAVMSCYRRAEDWTRYADPWAALGLLITRIEAEFPGRLLLGPDDSTRWRAEPEALLLGRHRRRRVRPPGAHARRPRPPRVAVRARGAAVPAGLHCLQPARRLVDDGRCSGPDRPRSRFPAGAGRPRRRTRPPDARPGPP